MGGVVHASNEKSIRVVIVEPECLYRDLLRGALSRLHGIEVVGDFADGDEAVRALAALRPDVAVLDVDLAKSNGIQVALAMRQQRVDLGVVLLSSQRDLGVLTSIPNNLLFRWSYLVNKTSHNVASLGGAVRMTAARLLTVSGDGAGDDLLPASVARLSGRQWEILELVARGMTNSGIARLLGLKEKTVENQLAVVYEKLGIERERTAEHPRVKAVLRYLSTLGGGSSEEAVS